MRSLASAKSRHIATLDTIMDGGAATPAPRGDIAVVDGLSKALASVSHALREDTVHQLVFHPLRAQPCARAGTTAHRRPLLQPHAVLAGIARRAAAERTPAQRVHIALQRLQHRHSAQQDPTVHLEHHPQQHALLESFVPPALCPQQRARRATAVAQRAFQCRIRAQPKHTAPLALWHPDHVRSHTTAQQPAPLQLFVPWEVSVGERWRCLNRAPKDIRVRLQAPCLCYTRKIRSRKRVVRSNSQLHLAQTFSRRLGQPQVFSGSVDWVALRIPCIVMRNGS